MERITLQTKLFALFLIIALIPLVIISYVGYNTFSNTLEERSLVETQNTIMLEAKTIENFLVNAESDILFLSELPSLKALINAGTEEEARAAKKDLQQEFLAFSKNRKIYYQIRYIDENGQEIVRIDSDGIAPKIIPENKLQNKKGRYYFDDTMKISPGQVFVSPLDLNIEHGEIEVPYKPVIRYGTPVIDKNNNKKGIVLTNLYASFFLDNIQKLKHAEMKTFLVNKDGFYISNPNKSKEWGFMFNNGKNLKKEYPELASQILSNKPGQILEGDNLISFVPIFPSSTETISSTGSPEAYASSLSTVQGRDYFWVMVGIMQKKKVFESIIKLRNQVLAIGSAIIILVILLSYIISITITAGIRDRNELLENLLQAFKGKFGNIAVILISNSIQKLTKKNPRIIDILPESMVKVIEKKEKLRKELKKKETD